ncbi:MAG: 2-hydroxyglutaryl-CoA dehydratase [Ruminococcaceae bacterium]|nr:2-hydroxyglutaryl-CoA dehydratase [Oscillospiraceae bacterium]
MKGANMTKEYSLGIDIGSTTVKTVLRENDSVVYEKYERHMSRVRLKTLEMLEEMRPILEGKEFTVALSGSAGLGLAEACGVPFVQEVFATGEVVKNLEPDASAVIELGGEDAKIIFFEGGTDERMNGTCAGGTGAFIDQMATLLDLDVDTMDKLSLDCRRIYPIASRCGVFAKTDVQPLLNQGARKEDVAASIYQAVVNQTIAGLAQGRSIRGKVLFLGGPLYYCHGLRERFKETLKLRDEEAVFPEYARFAVALGASFYAAKTGHYTELDTLVDKIRSSLSGVVNTNRLPALFANEDEYKAFKDRHAKADVRYAEITSYSGRAYLGIDCGSTTTKIVLLSENDEILYTYYSSNRGNPVEIVREQLFAIYDLCGDRVKICGSAVTGYGEELIKNAFGVDLGVVETIAHYTAAKFFLPSVDFILDIGGQDIKCFRIRNGAIDSIMLNEACSSGCGSFIETFAKSMGYSIDEFAKKGLMSPAPVNLGSRCTVFMNSSVKQSQRDGATVEDISAGLSVSVVKNAIYKVIRAGSADELGENIVVQGGTFYNDAVLRAFEQELGRNVIRPAIAGLMGAYGAALYSKRIKKSTLMPREELEKFEHTSRSAVCKGCTNNCHLTVNTFSGGKKYISGNQCERGLGLEKVSENIPNLHAFKREYLTNLQKENGNAKRGTLGLPLSLGMYELLPFWHSLFSELGFDVRVSSMSTKRTYEKGQFSIPSDTACYPAKIMHGHIEELVEGGVDAIFYPCLTYNIDEGVSDNHYNCPVVAYYSELLGGNMESLERVKFLYPYLNINSKKELVRGLFEYLSKFYPDIKKNEIRRAVKLGFLEYDKYMAAIRKEGERALAFAKENGKRIMVLAGRPYHADAEIGHGIDKLAVSLGFVVVSEDSICHLSEPVAVRVLNQWTYHARLYRAAKYVSEHSDTELVQLVSFGCGVDAITTDEVRSILEEKGKFYTQIKIDEITNLGAVKIRLRSLIGALEQ